MAYEADRVVVEVIGKLDQLDTPVKTSTATFETSMDKIAAAATKAETAVAKSSNARVQAIQRESAQISQFSKALARDMDFAGAHITGPNSPFVAPVKEAPKVTNALRLVQTGGVALAGVLGGAVVTATMAAVEALAEMILKSDSAEEKIGDLVEKLKENAENTELAKRAQQIFGETLEGVTQALDENEKALKHLNDQQVTAAQQALINAEKQKIILQGIRDETQAQIDLARSLLEVQKARAAGPGQRGEIASLGLEQRFATLDALEARLKNTDDQIKRANDQITEALSHAAVELSEQQSTAVGQIEAKYKRLIDQARQRAIAEGTVRTTLKAQTDELNRQKQIELDAARKKPSASRDAQLPKVTQAEVISVIKEVFGSGTRITSTTRTPAQNAAANGAANSHHLTGTAIDFVPQKGMQAFDKELLRLALEARGIKAVELLGPGDKEHGDHGHVAFQRKRLGPDQVASAQERAAREAERLATQEANREQAYQNEKANLEGQVIDARQNLITSVEEIAKLELQAIEISRAKYADQVVNAEQVGKLHKDEAAELLKLNEERAKLRIEAVNRRLAEQRARIREAAARRALEVQTAGIDAHVELLESQENLVKTARERHAIERRIIDLQFKEERLRLENQIAIARQVQANKDGAYSAEQIKDAIAAEAEARAQLRTLPERQANAQSGNDLQNASPLQDFFNQIPQTTDQINDAFEQIAAGGLATFTDALTNAIVNFESLGQVGRAVLLGLTTDLVKLAIRLVLNATIGRVVSKIATASAATEAASLAAAWAPAAAAASLATLGANAGPAIAAISAANAAALGFAAASGAGSTGGGFAEGGRIFGPGSSTSDSIPIRASTDEFMVKAKSARSVGYDNLDYINQHGELPYHPSGYANGGRIRPSNAVAARPLGHSASALSEDALRRIEGAVERGAAAQAPVNLFPVMSPRDAAQAMLADPAAQRVFFEWFGQNNTRLQASRR